MEIKEILKNYWGYEEFRPLQEDIIRSVIDGKDTLALMPTGGGKSITYQVPGLYMNGVCLVITPLIALMKDQVEELKAYGVEAEAVYMGMERNTVESIFNKAIGGKIKFLYISPERLSSDTFRQKLKLMEISMIAVDEAHCISQWGYDFRPPYLRIAEVRDFFPDIPVLALTATATPRVVTDIQDKLKFKEKRVLSTSFRRSNLAYIVRETEDKPGELFHILSRIEASGIVYVRKRKTTKELADFLTSRGIKAGYYHAGLSAPERAQKQEEWKEGIIPVIVATNAFGMGINKAEVRMVVHYDIPDTVEAYFQEAGRAGRDGKKAYAVLLDNEASRAGLKKRIAKNFPDISYIKNIYFLLGNFFQIAESAGKGYSFEFDADAFIKNFKLERLKTFSALRILEMGGYIECSDNINRRSRIIFTVGRNQLDSFHTSGRLMDSLLELLLRTCPGIFSQYVYIDEQYLAQKLDTDRNTIYEMLLELSKSKIINYIPRNDQLFVVYTQPRLPLTHIRISNEVYTERKKVYTSGILDMMRYIENEDSCRQLSLIRYFGQREKTRCGICDVCIRKNRLSGAEKREIDQKIITLLSEELHIKKLLSYFEDEKRETVIQRIRKLLDEGKIGYTGMFRLGGKK